MLHNAPPLVASSRGTVVKTDLVRMAAQSLCLELRRLELFGLCHAPIHGRAARERCACDLRIDDYTIAIKLTGTNTQHLHEFATIKSTPAMKRTRTNGCRQELPGREHDIGTTAIRDNNRGLRVLAELWSRAIRWNTGVSRLHHLASCRRERASDHKHRKNCSDGQLLPHWRLTCSFLTLAKHSWAPYHPESGKKRQAPCRACEKTVVQRRMSSIDLGGGQLQCVPTGQSVSALHSVRPRSPSVAAPEVFSSLVCCDASIRSPASGWLLVPRPVSPRSRQAISPLPQTRKSPNSSLCDVLQPNCISGSLCMVRATERHSPTELLLGPSFGRSSAAEQQTPTGPLTPHRS